MRQPLCYKNITCGFKVELCKNYCLFRITKTSSITLKKTTDTLNAGQTDQLIATTNSNRPIAWKSSNSSVVRVDNNGQITAIRKGTAVIFASCDGSIQICNVTVNDQGLSDVILNKTADTLGKGQTFV